MSVQVEFSKCRIRRKMDSNFIIRPRPPFLPLVELDKGCDYRDHCSRLFNLTQVSALLRPWWMGSESPFYPFCHDLLLRPLKVPSDLRLRLFCELSLIVSCFCSLCGAQSFSRVSGRKEEIFWQLRDRSVRWKNSCQERDGRQKFIWQNHLKAKL